MILSFHDVKDFIMDSDQRFFHYTKLQDLLQQKFKRKTEFEVEPLPVSKGVSSIFGFGTISLYSLGSRLKLITNFQTLGIKCGQILGERPSGLGRCVRIIFRFNPR